MKQPFCFDDAVATYMVTAEKIPAFSRHTPIAGGRLVVSHTSKTDVRTCCRGNREIAILGFCVDAHGELSREEIPSWFLSRKLTDPELAYRCFDRFAGKYAVIFSDGDTTNVWGDASCSVPVSYGFREGRVCLSSSEYLAAQFLGLPESPYGKHIRFGSDFFQGMPGDLTPYQDVRMLLPNHYLALEQRKPVRVSVTIPERSPEEIMDISDQLIRSILRAYAETYDIVCPLTSGYDSRLVFAYLKAQNSNLDCYTFRHPNFSENADDVWVPKKLCKLFDLSYHLIDDLTAPEAWLDAIRQVVGPYHAPRTMHLAYTYLSKWKGKALVNGDISDQIGKSLLGNTIPTCLAGPRYFQCKIHNTAPEARQALNAWLDEIRQAGQWDYVFDLFALENRCGRWASQVNMIYALCGIDGLNLFNCRELIQLWMGLPRKLRVRCQIHKTLMERLDPKLLEIPFNPGENRTNFLKQNWILFYLATFLKFFLQKLRSRRAKG